MNNRYIKDFSEYNDNLCNLAISKENVRRIYYSSFIFIILGIVLAIISKSGINDNMASTKYFGIVITEIVSSVIFAFLSRLLIKQKQKSKFKILTLIFWVYLIFLAEVFSLEAARPFGALMPIFIVIVSLAMLPIFHKIEIGVLAGLQLIAMLISAVFEKITFSEIVYGIMFLCICVMTSMIRYNNYRLNFRYKSKLDVAIRQSETDKLTGILNRRGLERGVYDLWEMWIQNKTNIAVIMLDIDNFKKYNDAFGHMQGDACLRQVSSEIRSAIRKNIDFAARVGGEEFLIVLSDISASNAVTWIKRLKANIENLMITQSSKNFLPYVTVSSGLICTSPSRSVRFDNLYNLADQELYNAKESGRACFSYKGKIYDQRIPSDYGYAKVANFDGRFRI